MMYTHHYHLIASSHLNALQLTPLASQITEILTKSHSLGVTDLNLQTIQQPLSIEIKFQSSTVGNLSEQLLTLLKEQIEHFDQQFKDINQPSPQHHQCHHGHCNHAHFHQENHKLKALIGLLWGLSQLIYPFATPLVTAFNALLTLYLGLSVYQSAWHALQERQIVMTTLYSISTLSILFISMFSYFIPWLPIMSEAAPLILGFWHLGEFIESHLVSTINKQLDVRDCLPLEVTLKGNPDKTILSKKIQATDTIIVPNGIVIPVDGIIKTSATLSTTRINGAPLPKFFEAGEAVKSGMSIADQSPFVEIEATRHFNQSYLSLVAQNIKQAQSEKAPIELLANTILGYFIPGLVAIALSSGVIISSLFGPVVALQCVISVLVSACPCALSLITPLAVKIGMQKSSERGIHFKNGKDLQAAADITDVVFDLNGTLTEGEIEVKQFRINDSTFLPHLALLQSQSEHPKAKLILDHINRQGVMSNEELILTDVDKSHRSGIKATINGEVFMIGNKKLLEAHHIFDIPAPYDDKENGSHYIVKGHEVIGQIHVQDRLRADAVETVKTLQKMGKTVHICTGDDEDSAAQFVKLLNIKKEHVLANAGGASDDDNRIPKSSYIQALKNKRAKVAMVGDNFNDLSAFACSDIAIAVQSNIGDKITQAHAAITVNKGHLFSIVTALDVSQKTSNNILQNLVMSLSYNSVVTIIASGALIACGISLNPVVGAALMIMESLIVLCNLIRFKYQVVIENTYTLENHQVAHSSTFFAHNNASDCCEHTCTLEH